MKRVCAVLLTGSCFLAGCESNFDRCMSTELPRAEALAGIEAERDAGRQLVSMKELLNKFDTVDIAMETWFNENPRPIEYPAYNCKDKSGAEWTDCSLAHDKMVVKFQAEVKLWEASPVGQQWVNLRDNEIEKLGREIGLEISDEESYTALVNQVWDQFDTVLKPRSSIFQCLEDYKCDDYSWGDENSLEFVEKAFDEAILSNASEISQLVETAQELATVTCNNNGFYE